MIHHFNSRRAISSNVFNYWCNIWGTVHKMRTAGHIEQIFLAKNFQFKVSSCVCRCLREQPVDVIADMLTPAVYKAGVRYLSVVIGRFLLI